MKMKKNLLNACKALMLGTAVVLSSFSAYAIKTQITVTEYGSLKSLLGESCNTVDSLIVSGPIDATDFRTMYESSLNGKLTYLNLKDAVAKDGKIPDSAFWDISEQATSNWTAKALQLNTLILPDNTTEIGYQSLYLLHLKDFELPLSVRKLSYYSFGKMNFGTDVLIIPEGIDTIPDYCFEGVTELTTVNLPTSLRSINPEAFANTSIVDVNIKEGVESIGNTVFHDSRLIKTLTIPNSCTSLGMHALANLFGMKTLVLGDNITEIPYGCMMQDSELEYVKLPATLETIDYQAFYYCEKLASINFPESLRTIKEEAFKYTALDSIVLPKNVTRIETNAFSTSKAVSYIKCYSTLPPECVASTGEPTSSIFGQYTLYTTPLYVPAGSKEAYQNVECWKDFINIIEFESDKTGAVSALISENRALISVDNDNVIITPEYGASVGYAIYNMSGSIVAEGTTNSDGCSINLAKGVYVVVAGNNRLKIAI
jgi:hypothetical protein